MRMKQWIPRTLLGALMTGVPRMAGGQVPTGYVGSEACIACHDAAAAEFSATTMGRLFLERPRSEHERKGCEACHGPGQQHVDAGGEESGPMITFGRTDKTPVADRNAVCLTCHQQSSRMFWTGGGHDSREVACTDCHDPMRNTSDRNNLQKATELATCTQCHLQRRSQRLRFSHMPVGEGKMECTSCHNPHGTANEKNLIAPSVNEVCTTCHAEKRGPFLWEHPPVTENCANCHDPHGSNHEKLLKVAKARLCQQCHAGEGHPTRPGDPAADAKYWLGRQCANCHTMLHGSNHTGGRAFTR